MGFETIKISVRLRAESLDWIDEQVRMVGENKTNRTAEIEKCIMARRIAMMPKWKQERLAQHLANGKAVET